MSRLNLITDPAFDGLKATLAERMSRLGAEIHAAQFATLLDPVLRGIVQRGFADAGAHEGTIWLVDATEKFLEPAYNTGPSAEKFVGHFQQPLSAGLISMVFATEQPFLENDVSHNTQQSKLLDSHLNVQTHALIAVPFNFLNACRGVVSCVLLKTDEKLTGFQPEHLQSVQQTASWVAQLIEYRLLSRTVGWTCE